MKVRSYHLPDRQSPWYCSWYVDGKRKAKAFPNREARDTWASGIKAKQRDLGMGYLRLEPSRYRAWLLAEDMLNGADPVEVAKFWLSAQAPRFNKALGDSVAAFLAERAARGFSSQYVSHLKKHLKEFSKRITGASENWQMLPAEFIRTWIYGLPYKPETKGTYLKSVRTFYSFCAGEKWVEANPAKSVKAPKFHAPEIQFLTADAMARLLNTAWERDRELCGYLALGAFAGMRSSAILRVDPVADLRFSERAISMPASKTKTGRRFFVQGFPPNLWAWLKASPPAVIAQRPWDDRRAAVAAWANVEMPHNALRHSFASHHVALTGNADKTATLLTHRGTKQLWNHYRGNATKADAKKYFSILPPLV